MNEIGGRSTRRYTAIHASIRNTAIHARTSPNPHARQPLPTYANPSSAFSPAYLARRLERLVPSPEGPCYRFPVPNRNLERLYTPIHGDTRLSAQPPAHQPRGGTRTSAFLKPMPTYTNHTQHFSSTYLAKRLECGRLLPLSRPKQKP